MSGMPTWEGFMVPVLRVLSDGKVRPVRDLRREVSDAAGLSDEARREQLPSGQFLSENRIGWAVSYLTRVGALDRPTRGHYAIAQVGRELLDAHPSGLVQADLRPLVQEGDEWWLGKARTPGVASASGPEEASTALDPTEQVEQGIARIDADVAAELLQRLHSREPEFFEQAVVDLLLAMGYGGAHGRGAVTQLTHDGGIDGVIDQDALGLNKVYVQAKRYAPGNSVQKPEVQGFVGALSGKADGGLFITTGRFSSGAVDYAAAVPARIILVDGARLTSLMIRYGVGVQVKQTVNVVEIDEDFFA